MKAFAGLWAVLAACGFEHGARPGTGPDDGGIDGLIDSAPDAMLDAFDPNCFGKAPFSLCLAALPTQPLIINSNIDSTPDANAATCDSGRGIVMIVGGTSSCVIAATNITFSGSTTGSSGTQPIVFAATGSISLTSTQTLDARSASTGGGPGLNPTDCGDPPNGAASLSGGGGGAGGSFGSKGGDGGGGGLASGVVAAGGVGKPAAITPVTKLRGGCPGGDGAAGSFTSLGGAGGGAVYFVARQTVQIDGVVTVSGAGGVGGQSAKGGGGGGGSGGMILLDGGVISIGANARLMANGGGGGGGAGAALDGTSGSDATIINAPASGGSAGGGGTAGGNGAFKSTPAVSAAESQNGGGGGGGGVGVIRVLSGQTVNQNNFSPAASS